MKNHKGNTGRVLEYLKTHSGITSKEAFELFGATRLSAIIFNLRKDYKIINIKHHAPNRYGEKTAFDEYQLVGEYVE